MSLIFFFLGEGGGEVIKGRLFICYEMGGLEGKLVRCGTLTREGEVICFEAWQ